MPDQQSDAPLRGAIRGVLNQYSRQIRIMIGTVTQLSRGDSTVSRHGMGACGRSLCASHPALEAIARRLRGITVLALMGVETQTRGVYCLAHCYLVASKTTHGDSCRTMGPLDSMNASSVVQCPPAVRRPAASQTRRTTAGSL